jgi:hypothetical protein
MNILRTVFCGCLMLFSLALTAQERSFPENIPYHTRFEVGTAALEKLFHCTGALSMQLAPGLHITGTVQSRTERGPSVVSILIRVENPQGAMLSLSRSQESDGSVRFTGHLLRLHDPDGMLLVEQDGLYYFIRTEQRYLVAE